MDKFAKLYRLKEGSIGPPTRYLGADIGTIANSFGKECWAMSSESYIRNAVRIVDGYMEEAKVEHIKAKCPFHDNKYKPELDEIPLLGLKMILR